MRTLLLICTLLLTLNSVSWGQYPAYLDSVSTDYISYIDAGIGTYGFEVGVTGEPVENWGGSLFLRGYPGPIGPLYSIDSRYMIGAELKYYGILSDGFFTGPLIAGEILPAFRPIAGIVWGYDFFTRFRDQSQFKNIHINFEFQAGIDTEGDHFIGFGVSVGIGFRNDEELINYR